MRCFHRRCATSKTAYSAGESTGVPNRMKINKTMMMVKMRSFSFVRCRHTGVDGSEEATTRRHRRRRQLIRLTSLTVGGVPPVHDATEIQSFNQRQSPIPVGGLGPTTYSVDDVHQARVAGELVDG